VNPIRFKPGDLVAYTNAKWPKHGMGPRGPASKEAIRLTAVVVGQSPGYLGVLHRTHAETGEPEMARVGSPMNVLLRFSNGRMAVTTWGHCRRVKPTTQRSGGER